MLTFTRQSRLAALLFILAVLVYIDSFPGSFIADDYGIVVKNPLRAGSILEILKTDYWGPGVNSGLYRPLTIFSYLLNRSLLGPGILSFHLVNVLLHGGATILLFLALRALAFREGVAWLAAALFAVHPIHAEVVNIVTGRAELLAAVFIFLGLWTALRRQGSLYAVSICYAAALLSKENGVTFPALLYITDSFRERSLGASLRKRWPLYLVLSVITAAWLIFRKWGLPSSNLPTNLFYAVDNPMVELGTAGRLLTAAKVQLLYLARLCLPVESNAVFVDTMIGAVREIPSPWGAASLSFLVFVPAIAVWGWGKWKGYGLGMLFYLTSFAVTANVFFLTPFLMAERFAYTPSAGFFLAAASLAPLEAIERFPAWARRGAMILAVAYVAALGARTMERNRDFQSNIRLWKSEVTSNPKNVRAWVYLAGAYQLEGRDGEAENAFRAAIAADPRFIESYLSLGYHLLDKGRPQEAVEYFHHVVEQASGTSLSALSGLARSYLLLGQPGEALVWLDEMPRFFENSGTWKQRGMALEALDRRDEAVEAYRRALGFGVDPETLHRLGRLLLEEGRYREAEEAYRAKLKVEPSAPAYNDLGVSLSLQGRHAEATEAYRNALNFNPSNQEYRSNFEKASRQAAGSRDDPGTVR